jgi:hypothetical protein
MAGWRQDLENLVTNLLRRGFGEWPSFAKAAAGVMRGRDKTRRGQPPDEIHRDKFRFVPTKDAAGARDHTYSQSLTRRQPRVARKILVLHSTRQPPTRGSQAMCMLIKDLRRSGAHVCANARLSGGLFSAVRDPRPEVIGGGG